MCANEGIAIKSYARRKSVSEVSKRAKIISFIDSGNERDVKGRVLGNICCNMLKEARRQLSEKWFFGTLHKAS